MTGQGSDAGRGLGRVADHTDEPIGLRIAFVSEPCNIRGHAALQLALV
jgi:hypothetical protein